MSDGYCNDACTPDKPRKPAKRIKPAKPYPDFPLTPHPAGYWCKSIRGKVHYFGRWEDLDAALAKYLDQKDALHAGRTPRPDPQSLAVKDVANAFLNRKQEAVSAGELSPGTWRDYRSIMDKLVAGLGKAKLVHTLDPQDFASLKSKLARDNSPPRMTVVVQVIRSAFKHVYDVGMIDTPMRFGPGFKRASAKTLRLHRGKQGPKMFTADEVCRMIDAAPSPQMKAMIFLGINCGYGPSDCGNLPLAAVDLDKAVIDFSRPKTGVARRCTLWPETVAAIRDALDCRPAPKLAADAGLVFITRCGQSWHKDDNANPLSAMTTKLLRSLGIGDGRKGLGFYALRHTFRTIADEARDQPAADYIMGHESTHMSSHYRERISDERLKAITDHVRTWLYPPETREATP